MVWSFHGKCLSTSCLTICKNSSVEPIKDSFNDWCSYLLKNIFLLGIRAVYSIKSEVMSTSSITGFISLSLHSYFFLSIFDSSGVATTQLKVVFRPNSAYYFNSVSLRSRHIFIEIIIRSSIQN